MFDFFSAAFKTLFAVVIVIAIIGIVIGGFICLNNSLLLGFLIWVGGFISIIVSAGMVSIFINIDDNIKNIKALLERNNVSENNNHENIIEKRKCPSCMEFI